MADEPARTISEADARAVADVIEQLKAIERDFERAVRRIEEKQVEPARKAALLDGLRAHHHNRRIPHLLRLDKLKKRIGG